MNEIRLIEKIVELTELSEKEATDIVASASSEPGVHQAAQTAMPVAGDESELAAEVAPEHTAEREALDKAVAKAENAWGQRRGAGPIDRAYSERSGLFA